MIIQPDGKDLVVPINESFWPTFLCGRLFIRAVKHSWCFCLNNQDERKQFIFVLASDGATELPAPNDLAAAFSLRAYGRHLSDVRDLPVRLYCLLELTGAYLHQLKMADRDMTILYGCNDEDLLNVSFADSVLVSFQISSDSSADVPWLKNSSDYHVLFSKYYSSFRLFNVIALVKSNAEVQFTPKVRIYASVLGDDFRIANGQAEKMH